MAHLRQFEPGLYFIGSPGGCAGGEGRLSFGRDYDGPIVFMGEGVLMDSLKMEQIVPISKGN
jgi:hypothetical protein